MNRTLRPTLTLGIFLSRAQRLTVQGLTPMASATWAASTNSGVIAASGSRPWRHTRLTPAPRQRRHHPRRPLPHLSRVQHPPVVGDAVKHALDHCAEHLVEGVVSRVCRAWGRTARPGQGRDVAGCAGLAILDGLHATGGAEVIKA